MEKLILDTFISPPEELKILSVWNNYQTIFLYPRASFNSQLECFFAIMEPYFVSCVQYEL